MIGEIWQNNHELWGMAFENLVGKDQHDWWELAKQDNSDEVFMLY
jgi:hypothetical protein